MVTVKELKAMWEEFFESHGFKPAANESLIPENDPTVLFTTAGMHPLVPFLLGEKHPLGNKLYNSQRCVRTTDIESVGDLSHLTFFEMLGNWTLGRCDKAEMIKLSFEFLTSKKYLGIPVEKLAVTVFEGNEDAPKDVITYNTWKKLGIKEIFYFPKEENWWALGSGTGPCGPCSEMFVDMGKPKCGPNCSPNCNCGKYMEIWNDVFMEFVVSSNGEMPKRLKHSNIDTGMGLERALCIINKVKSIYDTGFFKRVISFIEENSSVKYVEIPKPFRIIADHMRASSFILADERGITPSNVGQGYVLRRLIRRAVNAARQIGFKTTNFAHIFEMIADEYSDEYEIFKINGLKVTTEIEKEVGKFAGTISEGYKELEKVLSGNPSKTIDGKSAFRLYDTFGFPIELTLELAGERGFKVDLAGYELAFCEHREKSRDLTSGIFRGGLADTSNESAKLHTATHIMLAGLRKIFGGHIFQKGSNITPERLRFDFNLERKMTEAELKELESFVNNVIQRQIPVVCNEMSREEAEKLGALGVFTHKYGDIVKVYSILGISIEICGGPHASNTKELGRFKILKEESSGSGIRRIKAVLE